MADTRAAFVSRRLEAIADPDKAVGMAGYMYSKRYQDMYGDGTGAAAPFYGVQKPGRVAVLRALEAQFPISSVGEYRDAIDELWALPHREEKYLAVAVAQRHKSYQRMPQLDVYRRLIVEGGWWDIVDEVAIRCVGQVLLDERAAMAPILDEWAHDDDVWIRRSALIAHIKHKEQTDTEQLFRHCRELAGEQEFFIRKAIGWALREHAKTDPEAVAVFLEAHRSELSTLSFREASKHLDVS